MRLRILVLPALAVIAASAAPAGAQMFIEGTHYWFEPAEFPGTAPKNHPLGPDKARGLVIWNGGYDPGRNPLVKTIPLVQYFAEAGWDAYNLQRSTAVMGDHTPGVIITAIERAREKGYRRIILMGQSRGAYASIQAGAWHGNVHGILPLAPAGFGDYGKSGQWRENHFAVRQLWESYKGSQIRVAAGFFTGDDWYETKEPHVRGPYAKKRLTELGIPNFIIDQPAHPGMQGHTGGTSWQFARRYGPCLEHFFETGENPGCADDDAATAQLFGIKPPAVVDGDMAAGGPQYAGLWQGTWHNSGRFTALVIPPPSGGKVTGTYMLGKGVNGDRAEHSAMTFIVSGDSLVRDGKIQFRFALQPDGSLRGERLDTAKPDAPQNLVTLKRAR